MAEPKVYGWCPGALRPMRSGDGLVVRVRAPLGRLTPDQARGIAALARDHGNGLIDLSARANLQLRGVRDDSHGPVLDGLRALGLLDSSEAAESRRNIMVQPFWRDDDDTHQIARDLIAALAAGGAPNFSKKFGFAVDCGPQPVLSTAAADIRIERSNGGLICRADGASAGLPVTVQTAAQRAFEMAQWFIDAGGMQNGRGRMAALVARSPAPGNVAPLPALPAPVPGPHILGRLIALEFGQIRAETLEKVANLGALRLTPWRMLLIEGTQTAPYLPGLIHDAEDPRLNLNACTGAPGCLQALSDTRSIARQIAPLTRAPLHISGCAKGCAHPKPAAITLTATAPGQFDLIRNGRASDRPDRRGLTLTDLLNGAL